MRKQLTKTLSIILAASTILSTTGCSSVISDDVTKYPLVDPLTTQEVIDYYANAMKYDSVISRLNTVHETTYELKEIDGEAKEKIIGLVNQAEDILSKTEYSYENNNSKVLTEDTYHYLKTSLDNYKLTNSNVVNVQGALGYYFADVEYDASPRSTGSFNQKTSLLGIDGAIKEDAYGQSKIDIAFLIYAVDKMNTYYEENKIGKELVLDTSTGLITTVEKEVGSSSNSNTFEVMENTQADNFSTEETIPQAPEDDSNSEESDTSLEQNEESENLSNEELEEEINDLIENLDTDVIQASNESVTVDSRKCLLDIELFNKVSGTSSSGVHFMPELSEVFEIPENEGDFSGWGIYPSGSLGLRIFGCDRNNINGKITIRYVFKDTVDGTGNIIGTNAYIYSEKIDSGITVTESNVSIPEYLKNEFEILIDRADRVEIDNIISSMIETNIFEDMGIGVLRGYESVHTNVLKQMSVLRQVVARDIENNAYLLEVETTRIEGPKDADQYGTYRDKYYIVVEQKDNKFIITDKLRLSREISKEASISPDSAIEKRLVALGLTGEIVETTKLQIKDLMNNLYKASTYRKLRGAGQVEYKGTTVELEAGMYDCFNSDTSMLSSDELEYTNSKLRGVLTKYGNSVNSEMIGDITEWIGGTDNQAEFICEELVTYDGVKEAEYMQVYYLVSNMHDKWVIDERTVISQETVTGEDVNTIKSRINTVQ